MLNSKLSAKFVRRTLALAVVFGAGAAALSAQTPSAPPADHAAKPTLNLSTASLTGEAYSSSNAPADEASVDTAHMSFLGGTDAMQYQGRRRYGRPRYRGSNTNEDGSEKYTFYVGGGATLPTGNTYHYYTPSWNFQVGAGRNFNKHFAMNVQFDWDELGLQGSTLYNQATIYDPDGSQGIAGQNVLDGYAHVWSLSVDPQYTLYSGEGLGAYVIAGVGFYHKTTTFTLPEAGEYCDYYGFCYQYTANTPIDSYTSNAPGFNGGFGLTYKPSKFGNERFYLEARYVFVDNSQRQGVTINNYSTLESTYTGTNYFPVNSNRTTYVPVKVGIRF